MRHRFDEQLDKMNEELIRMGALCEEAINSAVMYLVERDENMRKSASRAEEQIDQKERDIENLCMKLLILQQPVAGDFRAISAALKMVSDMERIGDQAADITEMAEYVDLQLIKGKTHITDMAAAAVKMVTDSIESFVRKDRELAYAVIAHDDIVDELFSLVKEELIAEISAGFLDRRSGSDEGDISGRDAAESLTDLLMIAKYFERIGDHAENIAEWVIYSLSRGTEDA